MLRKRRVVNAVPSRNGVLFHKPGQFFCPFVLYLRVDLVSLVQQIPEMSYQDYELQQKTKSIFGSLFQFRNYPINFLVVNTPKQMAERV